MDFPPVEVKLWDSRVFYMAYRAIATQLFKYENIQSQVITLFLLMRKVQLL